MGRGRVTFRLAGQGRSPAGRFALRGSHASTVVSTPPEYNWPSGPNARAVTRGRGPRNSPRTVHVAASHNWIVPSGVATASPLPSGEKAPALAPTGSRATALPVATSQTNTWSAGQLFSGSLDTTVLAWDPRKAKRPAANPPANRP